ncbi:NAD(P)H-dependent oxidoreductase [Thermodesulfobacteriota bacterium]
MKVLIIYAHPNPDSFNHAILDAFTEGLSEAGHTSEVVDLYAAGFDPCLTFAELGALREGRTYDDVQAYQDKITQADALAFIHPNWFTGVPAILKGWIDRVLCMGFAYMYDMEKKIPIGLLKHRKAVVMNTSGAIEERAQETEAAPMLKKIWCHEILGFFGIHNVEYTPFFNVINTDDETRKGYLEKARKLGKEL